MPQNIFEILIQGGTQLVSNQTDVPVYNGEFNNFFLDETLNQEFPHLWTPFGFSDLNLVDANLLPNEDFTDTWLRGEFSFNDESLKASFLTPEGWDVQMHSISNSGATQDGNFNIESTSSNGYSYYNDGSEVMPSLTFVTKDSASTVGRVSFDDFSDLNNPQPLVGTEHWSYNPSAAIHFQNYRVLNQFSNSVNATASRKVLNNSSTDIITYRSSDGNDYNNYGQGFAGLYFEDQILVKEPMTTNPENGVLGGVPVYAPTIFRLKDIFTTESIGKKATITLNANFHSGTVNPSIVDDKYYYEYSTDNYGFESSLSISTASSIHLSNIAYGINELSGASSCSIVSNKLRIEGVGGDTTRAFIYVNESELGEGTESIVSVKVSHVQFNAKIKIYKQRAKYIDEIGNEVLEPHHGVDFIEAAAESSRIYRVAEKAVNASGVYNFNVKHYGLHDVERFLISIEGVNSPADLIVIDHIDVRVHSLGFRAKNYSLGSIAWNFFLDNGSWNMLSDDNLVITTNDFLEGYIAGYEDDGTTTAVETIFESGGGRSNRDDVNEDLGFRGWANPFATSSFDTIESGVHLINPKDEQPKNANGYYEDTYNDYTFEIDINSPHLNLFVDNSKSWQYLDANFRIGDIEIHTCEHAYVSKDSAGGDKIELYYDPQNTVVQAPSFSREISEDLIGSNLQLSIDVDSLDFSGTNLVKDNLKVTLGSLDWTISSTGVSTINTICDGTTLKIQPTGTTGYGLKAVINELNVTDDTTVVYIKCEQYGDPTVSPFEAGVYVYSTDDGLVDDVSLTGQYAPEYQEVINQSDNVKLFIDIENLYGGSSVTVSHQLNSVSPQEVEYTTSGLKEISIDDPAPQSSVITLKFKNTDALDQLSVKIKKLYIETTSTSGVKGVLKLDLYDSNEFPLTKSVKDFEHLSSTNGDYTKTVKIPATKNNKKVFKATSELSGMHQSDLANGINCIVNKGGVNVFKGLAFLDGTESDEHGEHSLNLTFKGGNGDWAELLRKKNLRDLTPTSDNRYKYIVPLMQNYSWSSTSEIVFSLIDSGKWNVAYDLGDDGEVLGVTKDHLKPSYKISKVFDRIFEEIGYTVKSNFFENNSEWGDGFGMDFANEWQKLVGVCPEPRVHEDDILKSRILLSTATQHNSSGIIDTSLATNKPHFNSTVPEGHRGVEWAVLNLSSIVDESSQHSLGTIATPNAIGEVVGTSTTLAVSGDSTTKSIINVAKDGYYNVATALNITGFANIYPNHPVKISVALVPNDSDFNTAFTTVGLDSLLFHNTDHHVELDSDTDGANAIDVNLTQYLISGVDYHVVVFAGYPNVLDLGEGTATGSTFIVHAAEVSIELSESVFPLEAYNLYYNQYHANGAKAEPSVTYREVLPDMTQLDFISDISKLFNLHWTSNPTTREIHVEPFRDFYDFDGSVDGYYNWSDKSNVIEVKTDSILKGDVHFKYAEDSSDGTLNRHSIEASVKMGDVKVATNRGRYSSEEDTVYQLDIFSTAKMHKENKLAYDIDEPQSKFSIDIPRIYSDDKFIDFVDNSQKPEVNVSHNHKLMFHEGWTQLPEGKRITYNLRTNTTLTWNYWMSEPFGGYPKSSTYSMSNTAVPVLTFGTQMRMLGGTEATSGGLYNKYHQSEIEMFKLRDKIITAEIYLTPYDVQNLNFRKLVVIGNNKYIINKIKDYQPNGDGVTEVELVLVTPRGTKEKIIN